MPPIQTTYTSDYAPAYAGMIANQETRNVISRNVQDAGGLAFGVPVFQGATDDAVTSTPGTVFRGISVVDKSVSPLGGDAYANFAAGATPYGINAGPSVDTAAVMTKGVVWVVASHAVVAGEPVFITAGGLFTDVASGDTALPGATFDSSAAAAGLVKIRLS